MGFMKKIPGLQTPGLDRMAREGAHIKNAFVSTALCSPSRASILTGQYAHTHTVVDNDAPLPANLKFFPQYLQQQGYQTAFLGKWHMGNSDDQPQPGFNYWLSFQGQGVYYDPVFNINGKRVKQPEGSYITDLLTDNAIDWMNKRDKNKPFFVYLSHKGVHAEFQPAKRHQGKYANMPVVCPPSMYLTATDSSKSYGIATPPATKVNYADIPQWVRRQRYSWHGVDYMYHGAIVFDEFYRRYLETLQAVDESVERVIEWVKQQKLEDNTIVMYMGDNGFSFGEHGLIDKRHAYEESMRVPMLVWAPGYGKTKLCDRTGNYECYCSHVSGIGRHVKARTNAGLFVYICSEKIHPCNGSEIKYSMNITGKRLSRKHLQPSRLRSNRYKYIFYNGTWDINELFDLQTDPYEMNNLIRDTAYRQIGLSLKDELFKWLQETNGLQIPLKKPVNRNDNLYKGTY
nr:acetylglucosamine-6-sulfatase [uncultured bacterium]